MSQFCDQPFDVCFGGACCWLMLVSLWLTGWLYIFFKCYNLDKIVPGNLVYPTIVDVYLIPLSYY
jgi:hypothetical protein